MQRDCVRLVEGSTATRSTLGDTAPSQRRSHSLAALVQPDPIALDAGLCQPSAVRARLACRSGKASQFVTRLWGTEFTGKVTKLSGPEIARKLNLSRSTIHCEINRSKSEPTALARDYQAGAAQLRSQGRRGAGAAERRKLGRDTDSPLWRTVQNGLRCHWSPEQIAGKLPRMNKAAMKAGLAMLETATLASAAVDEPPPPPPPPHPNSSPVMARRAASGDDESLRVNCKSFSS